MIDNIRLYADSLIWSIAIAIFIVNVTYAVVTVIKLKIRDMRGDAD